MDDIDDVNNVAYDMPVLAEKYYSIVRNFYETIAPPTAPAGSWRLQIMVYKR